MGNVQAQQVIEKYAALTGELQGRILWLEVALENAERQLAGGPVERDSEGTAA